MATLACNSGAYTIVGAVAHNNYISTIAAGAYTVTGTAAGVVYGHPITAVSGSYTITGVAIQTRRITAAPAAYQVQGQAVTLVYNSRILSIGSGSYSVTGSTSTKIESAKIYDRGAYDLTGTDAGLSRSSFPILTAVSGSYTLSGQAVVLVSTVPITTGDYRLTGTVASLKKGRSLLSNQGTYTIAAGPQVLLKATRRIVLNTGSYSTTGADVTLTRSTAIAKIIPIVSGVYTTTGTAAALPRTRYLSAAGGSYTLSGTAINFQAKLAAFTKAYTLTGTVASLRRGRLMTAAGTSYKLRGLGLAVDTTSITTSGSMGSGNNKSWSHTVLPGTNRAIYIAISYTAGQANRAVTAVTFNGLNANLVRSAVIGGGGTFSYTSTWVYINPPVLTGTILVTFGAAGITNGIGTAVNLTGAFQDIGIIGITNAQSNGTGSTAPSTTITGGNSNNIVFDTLTHLDTTATAGAGQTVLQNANFTSGRGATSYKTSGASVPMSWTLSLSAPWTIVAGELVTAETTKLRLTTAGANPILFASQGTYDLFGFTTNLRATKRITALGSSYTTTGTTAAFQRSRILPVDAGAYTWSGSSVSLPTKLPVASGTYSTTGQTAGLRIDHVLPALAASYSLVGKDALFVYVPVGTPAPIAASVGTYGLTGIDAGLMTGRVIILLAAASSYTLSGTDASIRNNLLLAESGQYLLSGTASLVATQKKRWARQPKTSSTFTTQPSQGTNWDPQGSPAGV